MTRRSFERLSEQVRKIKEVEIPRISREKLEASQQGDLSENAEYEAAKDRLDLLHNRLEQLGTQINGAQFIEDLPIPGNIVSLGTRVKLHDIDESSELEYCILGPADADAANNVISYQSPLAKGLMTRKIGEEVSIEIPSGRKRFRILGIEKYRI
jgi:transcription elongation factor GreA